MNTLIFKNADFNLSAKFTDEAYKDYFENHCISLYKLFGVVFEYESYIRKSYPEWEWGVPLDIKLPGSDIGIRKFLSDCVKYGTANIGSEMITLDYTYLKEYHLKIIAKDSGVRSVTITSTVDESIKY